MTPPVPLSKRLDHLAEVLIESKEYSQFCHLIYEASAELRERGEVVAWAFEYRTNKTGTNNWFWKKTVELVSEGGHRREEAPNLIRNVRPLYTHPTPAAAPPIKAWAVFNAKNEMVIGSIAFDESTSWFVCGKAMVSVDAAKRYGYTCRPISITPSAAPGEPK